MEGLQHNTYDIEFYGPNTMMGSLYVGALMAGARMAREMGQEDTAAGYEALARRGAAWMDRELFNGEYYIQRIEPNADRLSPVCDGRIHGRAGEGASAASRSTSSGRAAS